MIILYIILGAVLFLAILTLITSYICYRMTFYHKRPKVVSDEFTMMPGKAYEPFTEKMTAWAAEIKGTETAVFSIKSFDGLTLKAKYYEYKKGAPIELMMHGYKGRDNRDLCGGVQRCAQLGRSAFIVDQRACGHSEGKVITFGINEMRDCLSWVDFMVEHFGKDVKIILTGISMGASTVLMAAGEKLPQNVVGVLADSGFTSAKEIIKKVIGDMGLPPSLMYPFVKMGARVYGKFNPEENSALKAVEKIKLPVIFFHGEADDFVPCSMSKENYAACNSAKKLVTVPGAGHGLGYPVNEQRYLTVMSEFFTQNGVPTYIEKS